MKIFKIKLKFLALAIVVAAGLLLPVTHVIAAEDGGPDEVEIPNEDGGLGEEGGSGEVEIPDEEGGSDEDESEETPESDHVPVILRADGDADFLNISLFNAGELIFNDINHYSNHNIWINPQGGNIVDLVIDSSRAWTLAIEGTNFVGVEDDSQTIGLNRLRTRVQRAVLPNGQIIATNSLTNADNSSGPGLTGNQIGADNVFRNLIANGRQQMVVTNRVGRNFTYRMQFQFLGDQNIAEGEYHGSIRYAIWQR